MRLISRGDPRCGCGGALGPAAGQLSYRHASGGGWFGSTIASRMLECAACKTRLVLAGQFVGEFGNEVRRGEYVFAAGGVELDLAAYQAPPVTHA